MQVFLDESAQYFEENQDDEDLDYEEMERLAQMNKKREQLLMYIEDIRFNTLSMFIHVL